MTELKVLDLDASNLESAPCCGVKNRSHPGRQLKNCWMQKQFAEELGAKVLLTPDGRQCGYIEYLSGKTPGAGWKQEASKRSMRRSPITNSWC